MLAAIFQLALEALAATVKTLQIYGLQTTVRESMRR
jgi:hypothetical protein